MNQAIVNHSTVQNITFANKIGYERVGRLIIYIYRSSYLLNASFAHHHYSITQRKSLFLVVSYIHKRNAKTLMHLLQLHLHILTHLQVERRQRLVKQ